MDKARTLAAEKMALALRHVRRRAPLPDELVHHALEYLLWCEANPVERPEMLKDGTTAHVPVSRPPTLEGYGLYLVRQGLFTDPARVYAALRIKDDDYAEASTAIRAMFASVTLEGGMVGMYNAGLVGRYAGLYDKKAEEGAATEQPLFGDSAPLALTGDDEQDEDDGDGDDAGAGVEGLV